MSADEQHDFTLYCHPDDEDRAEQAAALAQPDLPGPLAVKVHPEVPAGGMFMVREQDLPPGWEPGHG